MAVTGTDTTSPGTPGRKSRRTVPFLSGVALLIGAVGMVGWIFVLAMTLRGSVRAHNWVATWVGLDIAEFVMLVIIGIALIRRHPRTDVVAAIGATLFIVDAWFDVMLAGDRTIGQAVLLACVAEIPITLALSYAAWRSRRWFGPPVAHPDSP